MGCDSQFDNDDVKDNTGAPTTPREPKVYKEGPLGKFPVPDSQLKELLKQAKDKREMVNHPSHYGGDTTYEAIKVIHAWGVGFNLGSVLKYICRAGKKHPDLIEDLKKAAWYLNDEIQHLEKERDARSTQDGGVS